MYKLRFYWEFHKSTLVINWAFSCSMGMILMNLWLIPLVAMIAGPLLSLFYKEIARKNEYYFYYNRGISKISLITMSMIMNILTGLLLLFIILEWQANSKLTV